MDVTGIAQTYDIPTPAPTPIPQESAAPAAPAVQASSGMQASADQTEKTTAGQIKSPAEMAADKLSTKQSNEILDKTIEEINKSISTFNREMHVSVHEKTKKIMVKVMDTEENKVIRELPPERVLDAFARTLELAGILVDKKS